MKTELKIKAVINYTIDKGHPDYKYIEDYKRGQILNYDDIYYIDLAYYNYDIDLIKEFIKEDLKLIAGGGYNSKHIHRVKFYFKFVSLEKN